MSDLLPLLAASVTIAEQKKQIVSLQTDNELLRARLQFMETKMVRLSDEMTDTVPMLLRRQAG